ncbi:unnamed protein product [Anisakis simplex]|uniref:MOFRL domain-containing protein n=2 Tax=Anisakis simplex TaxID=6269 RepID=A0A3P6S5Y2_ANISI|nr:unnamed protein product [Anisakis simplex]VDK62990.1 unnamed protein product [Anisakis simplex]
MRESRFLCHTASTTIAEDATHFGEQLADLIHQILVDGVKPESALESLNQANINIKCPDEDRIAILFGGETTVKVTGEGQGGRNQQIVLSALSKLLEKNTAQHLQGQFALLSSGTDGQDGPTEAAGAVLTSEDLALIAKEGSELKLDDVNEFLRNNDSYNFWKKFQDGVCHVQTGPTGTNVMDVQILLINKQKSEK